MAAALSANRLALGLTGGVLLAAGAAATLATGSPWAPPAALGVHAVVTVVVVTWFLHTAMVAEHSDPARPAMREQAGAADRGAPARDAPADEPAPSVATLALLAGTAVVAFMIAVTFVLDGI